MHVPRRVSVQVGVVLWIVEFLPMLDLCPVQVATQRANPVIGVCVPPVNDANARPLLTQRVSGHLLPLRVRAGDLCDGDTFGANPAKLGLQHVNQVLLS